MVWLTGKPLGTDALGREKKAKYDEKPKGIGDVYGLTSGYRNELRSEPIRKGPIELNWMAIICIVVRKRKKRRI